MAEIKERIAYLQGLAEGYGIDGGSREGQMMSEIINALALIAGEVETLRDEQQELSRYTEYLDLDLGDLEEEVYRDGDTLELVEMVCPRCGQTVYFEEDVLTSDEPLEVTCPDCGGVVYCSDRDETSADEKEKLLT